MLKRDESWNRIYIKTDFNNFSKKNNSAISPVNASPSNASASRRSFPSARLPPIVQSRPTKHYGGNRGLPTFATRGPIYPQAASPMATRPRMCDVVHFGETLRKEKTWKLTNSFRNEI